jgi:uncharacterized protein YkwD
MLEFVCFRCRLRAPRQSRRRTASHPSLQPLRRPFGRARQRAFAFHSALLLLALSLLGNGFILHPRALWAQGDHGNIADTAPNAAQPEVAQPEAGQPEATHVTPKAFLPMVMIGQNVERAVLMCNPTEKEQRLAQLLKDDPAQGRRTMRCNPILQQVARARAEDMARRGYVSHTDPDGYGPNYHVLQAGYELPSWYDRSKAGNNIESIGAGYTDAAAVLAAWRAHPPHNNHPFGLIEFHAEQTEYGIGHYFSNSAPFREYWVLITAPPTND